MTEKELFQESLLIRKYLEDHREDRRFRDAGIFMFPAGCCDFSSELLAIHLQNKDMQNTYLYVRGHDELERYHAWVECNDYIIDITADQFPEINGNIIISKSSQFHKRYTVLDKTEIRKRRLMDVTRYLIEDME